MLDPLMKGILDNQTDKFPKNIRWDLICLFPSTLLPLPHAAEANISLSIKILIMWIYLHIYIFKSIILFYSHTCYFCKHKKERIISQTVSYLLIRFFLKSFSPEALTQRKTWYHKFIINDKTKKHSFHKEKKIMLGILAYFSFNHLFTWFLSPRKRAMRPEKL